MKILNFIKEFISWFLAPSEIENKIMEHRQKYYPYYYWGKEGI